MALKAEAPVRMAAHVINGQLLALGTVPARLQQQFGPRILRLAQLLGFARHGLGKGEILRPVHHHLQFLAGPQHRAVGGAMG
jgi:hypothetical protein